MSAVLTRSVGLVQVAANYIAVAEPGEVNRTLAALKASPSTTKAKARFILSTDGVDFEAEDLVCGETVACVYPALPDHFGFFLPLAGITTVKQLYTKMAANGVKTRPASKAARGKKS